MKIILSVFTFMLLFSSCKKTKTILIAEGTYTGTFKVMYNTGTQTGPVTVDLINSHYNCSHNLNKIPARGSGSYSYNNDKITFNDQGIWTADFDWGLVLGGEYNYSLSENSLIIWKDINGIPRYEYDLIKK